MSSQLGLARVKAGTSQQALLACVVNHQQEYYRIDWQIERSFQTTLRWKLVWQTSKGEEGSYAIIRWICAACHRMALKWYGQTMLSPMAVLRSWASDNNDAWRILHLLLDRRHIANVISSLWFFPRMMAVLMRTVLSDRIFLQIVIWPSLSNLVGPLRSKIRKHNL